jgi:hypothetical protein
MGNLTRFSTPVFERNIFLASGISSKIFANHDAFTEIFATERAVDNTGL